MSSRVGLIVPSSNTVIEVDFYRRLPADATLHTARMYLEQTTPEGESVMLKMPGFMQTYMQQMTPDMTRMQRNIANRVRTEVLKQ